MKTILFEQLFQLMRKLFFFHVIQSHFDTFKWNAISLLKWHYRSILVSEEYHFMSNLSKLILAWSLELNAIDGKALCQGNDNNMSTHKVDGGDEKFEQQTNKTIKQPS